MLGNCPACLLPGVSGNSNIPAGLHWKEIRPHYDLATVDEDILLIVIWYFLEIFLKLWQKAHLTSQVEIP